MTQELAHLAFDRILARNEKFKHRNDGETCYIVGNGPSLKFMELGAFADHPAIGLNFLCLHHELRHLDLRYYAVPEAFFFYPWRKTIPYDGSGMKPSYQENVFGKLLRQAFLRPHADVPVFTSVSNYLGATTPNTYFLYHFGHRLPDRNICDISGEFSFMAGALYAAVGLAINLGFRKAFLVGSDYLFSPMNHGYFYTHGSPYRSDRDVNVFKNLFDATDGLIELRVITDRGESRWLPSQDYESFTGKPLRFRENDELVAPEYLKQLQHAVDLKQLNQPIYGPA